MRTLCASTLIGEFFVIGFAGLVAMKNPDLTQATVWTVCGIAMLLSVSTGSATVVFARTSEPPCFSVIAMPHVAPAFCSDGRFDGSYSRVVSRGSHAAASSGACRSAGTTEYVIEIGHTWPPST